MTVKDEADRTIPIKLWDRHAEDDTLFEDATVRLDDVYVDKYYQQKFLSTSNGTIITVSRNICSQIKILRIYIEKVMHNFQFILKNTLIQVVKRIFLSIEGLVHNNTMML